MLQLLDQVAYHSWFKKCIEQSKPIIFTKQFENESTVKHREWFRKKNQSLLFLTSLPSLFHVNFVLAHDILYGRISWYSMVIYGTNIGANHKQKQLKFFFYRVPLKSILKYIFYWKYFFHSDSTCPRIAEKTLTPFLTLP